MNADLTAEPPYFAESHDAANVERHGEQFGRTLFDGIGDSPNGQRSGKATPYKPTQERCRACGAFANYGVGPSGPAFFARGAEHRWYCREHVGMVAIAITQKIDLVSKAGE